MWTINIALLTELDDDEHLDSRPALWAARAGQETGLHVHCRADAGLRHRREHRHLFGRQRRALAPAALPAARTTGEGLSGRPFDGLKSRADYLVLPAL